MGQVIGSENLPDLVIASTTTITMATTYLGKQTRISVGGQQYLYSSLITINFATTGINGLDTGAIAANSLYYIYSVQTSNTPGLVASLAAPTTGPTGFTAWKEVARVRTLQTAATLAQIRNKLGGTSLLLVFDWQSYTPNTAGFGTITSPLFQYKINGPSIDVYGRFTSGSHTAVQPWVYLPTGFTSKVVTYTNMGEWVLGIAVGTVRKTGKLFISTGTDFVRLVSDDYTSADSPFSATLLATNLTGGTAYGFRFSIPVAELVGL